MNTDSDICIKKYRSQQSMHQWFWSSTIIGITTVICIGIIQIKLAHEHQTTQLGIERLQPLMKKFKNCLDQSCSFKTKGTHITAQLNKRKKIAETPTSPIDALDLLELPDTCTLNNLTFKKKHIQITLCAPLIPQLLEYTHTLQSNEACSAVTMTTIEQTEHAQATVAFVML